MNRHCSTVYKVDFEKRLPSLLILLHIYDFFRRMHSCLSHIYNIVCTYVCASKNSLNDVLRVFSLLIVKNIGSCSNQIILYYKNIVLSSKVENRLNVRGWT